MSNLYGSMTTDASRGGGCTHRGHRSMSCHLRGWDEGVQVFVAYDGDKVRWEVYRTGGSNGHKPAQLIASGEEGKEAEVAP